MVNEQKSLFLAFLLPPLSLVIKTYSFPLHASFLFSFTLVSLLSWHYSSNMCSKRWASHRFLLFYKNKVITAHWETSSNLKLFFVISVYIISFSSTTLLEKKSGLVGWVVLSSEEGGSTGGAVTKLFQKVAVKPVFINDTILP